MASKLIIKTLLQALSRASEPTFLHSDMGSQYTSIAYEALCDAPNLEIKRLN